MDAESLKWQWGENIRRAREGKGMTQAALGEACGVNQSTVTKWEKGVVAPTDVNRIRLARIFGIPVGEMFKLCHCGLPVASEENCDFCADEGCAECASIPA